MDMRSTGMGFAPGRNIGTSRGITTGMKPPGTAMRDGIGAPGSVNARPLSKQGLNAPTTAMGKQERLYQDKKYFVIQLKNKNLELVQEIGKFKNQIETINKDNTSFITLEKKYEGLTKEVRELEGTLADYNLAVDKQRAGTRPEDIRNMYEHIKTQNDKFKAQLDDLFIERKTQEEQIQAIESQLHEIHQAAEMKLNELDPEQRAEYEDLVNENRVLIQNINAQRNQLDDINGALGQAEARLRLDHNKQRYIQLKEQTVELERKKGDLEVQTNENNLSFPEARDRLLAKVKEDNSVIQNTEKRIREVRKMQDNYEKQIKEMSSDNADAGRDAEQDKQKYEILYQRDKEMSEFIDNFESMRNTELNTIRALEEAIVRNLEDTSSKLMQNTDLPTVEEFEGMKVDQAIKENQLGMAKETLVRVQQEYEQRLGELRNLDTLEENIQRQVKTLKEKMQNMQQEIATKFNNVDQVRADKERRRAKLFRDREEFNGVRQKLKDELNSVSYDHELRKQKMSLHEQYGVLTDLEKKISQNENTLYNMKQFIQTKTVDMDYQNIKNECLGLMQDINQVLIRNS